MATLSKLDSRCEKCKNKDSCNNKRMMACVLAEMPKSNMKNMSMHNATLLMQPTSRKHTPITIKMGEYGEINTSMEEVTNKIAEQINKAFQINCAFNKS